jgi:hypothetical protein
MLKIISEHIKIKNAFKMNDYCRNENNVFRE